MEKEKMQVMKKTISIMITSLPIFLLFGCSPAPTQVDAVPLPNSTNRQQNDYIARRFQEPAQQGRTAVESAIELSQKYARLSDEAVALRTKHQDLIAQNSQLKEKAAELEAKLQQTQKELTEANDLLIEMRVELNNWKTNILGFREEMREAEKAELKALLDILKVLGGEVTAEPALEQGASSDNASSSESSQFEPKRDLIIGKSNE
jgi:chromosome segregation ATPase